MRKKVYDSDSERQAAYRKRKQEKERKRTITVWIDDLLYEQIKGEPQKVIDTFFNRKLQAGLSKVSIEEGGLLRKRNKLQSNINSLNIKRRDTELEVVALTNNRNLLQLDVNSLETTKKALIQEIFEYNTKRNLLQLDAISKPLPSMDIVNPPVKHNK
ncbi:hypothetical protein OMAG_001392, partial [Candidatus Omnitrophus magneticus]